MIIEMKYSNMYITDDRLLLTPKDEVVNDISIDDKYKRFIEVNLFADNNIEILDIATVFQVIPKIRVEHYQVVDLIGTTILESDYDSALFLDLSFNANIEIKLYNGSNLIYEHIDRFERYNNDAIFVSSYQEDVEITPSDEDELVFGTF